MVMFLDSIIQDYSIILLYLYSINTSLKIAWQDYKHFNETNINFLLQSNVNQTRHFTIFFSSFRLKHIIFLIF